MQTKAFHLKQLEAVFESRCRTNPRYSLRAYARDLGISVSRLSGVLNGKFGLSAGAALKISQRLGFSARTTAQFVDSVESNHSRSKKTRELATLRLNARKNSFKSLSLDQFQIISDWQHFAILELTLIEDFTAQDFGCVAKRFGISVIEAKRAIERLQSFDLLAADASGNLKATGSFLANPEGVASDAIRKHQKQLLKMAETAIERQSVEEREIRSLTIGIDRERLPELKKILSEFQRQFKNSANQTQTKNEVYALTMQFFRLTQKESL